LILLGIGWLASSGHAAPTAVYDPLTGGLLLEGVNGIRSLGLGRAVTSPTLNFEARNTTLADMSVGYDREVGWIFLEGFTGSQFDAGPILPTGLTTELSDLFLTTDGYASIPIVSNGQSYASRYDSVLTMEATWLPPTPAAPPAGSPPLYVPPSVSPPVGVPPMEEPPYAPPVVDPVGMHAIYDPLSGGLRFEGIDGIRGLGLSRSLSAPALNFAARNEANSDLSIGYEFELGWVFLEGFSGGGFDAGAVLPTGLTSELSELYILAGSTPVPIESNGVVYSSRYASAGEVEATWYPNPVEAPSTVLPLPIPIDPAPGPVDPITPPVWQPPTDPGTGGSVAIEVPASYPDSGLPESEPVQQPDLVVVPPRFLPGNNIDIMERGGIAFEGGFLIDPSESEWFRSTKGLVFWDGPNDFVYLDAMDGLVGDTFEQAPVSTTVMLYAYGSVDGSFNSQSQAAASSGEHVVPEPCSLIAMIPAAVLLLGSRRRSHA
jgi:hypothetical protein